jgi:hypothetical protein
MDIHRRRNGEGEPFEHWAIDQLELIDFENLEKVHETWLSFDELRTTSGVLDYQKLPSQVLDGLLGEVTYSIPQIVKQDLKEAIKCLKLGAPTASVMVGLRAVEGWLRELYCKLTEKTTKKAWVQLIKEIQNLLSERGIAIEPVVGFLNYVRDVRNTADHPDKSFSQMEAEKVFIAAATAIRELEKLR